MEKQKSLLKSSLSLPLSKLSKLVSEDVSSSENEHSTVTSMRSDHSGIIDDDKKFDEFAKSFCELVTSPRLLEFSRKDKKSASTISIAEKFDDDTNDEIESKPQIYIQSDSSGNTKEESKRETIIDIFSNQSKLACFKAFCKKEHSEENIDFLISVSEYKDMGNLGKTEQMAYLKKIKNLYIDKGSLFEINIDEALRETVSKNINELRNLDNVFDECVASVNLLLSSDTLMRFSKSVMYENYMNGLVEYNNHDLPVTDTNLSRKQSFNNLINMLKLKFKKSPPKEKVTNNIAGSSQYLSHD